MKLPPKIDFYRVIQRRCFWIRIGEINTYLLMGLKLQTVLESQYNQKKSYNAFKLYKLYLLAILFSSPSVFSDKQAL